LQGVSEYEDPNLEFLKTFVYDLGNEGLVPFGVAEAVQAGKEAFSRYQQLFDSQNLPFVRASGSTRVIHAATNWTEGFSTASQNKSQPKLAVILDESLNCTLDDSMCPKAGNGDAQANIWRGIYAAPIVARLNAGAPGANLSLEDIPSLISLCPFHTLAKEETSPFCALFSIPEFQAYEYHQDVDKYYRTGYGQRLGPVQGVGYVNELLARLTNQPVRDNTQTNRTLDSSPITFPLDRTVYADFSHDNEMIAIYSAIGLFRQPEPLNPSQFTYNRTWVLSRMVPFSSRLVTERVSCSGQHFVRMLVDDALQDLEFCGATGDGLCSIQAFVDSQGYARSDGNGDFEKCYN